MRYPFVLFDVGETLLGPRDSFRATYARELEPLGLVATPEAWERALRASWEELNRLVPRGADRYAHFPDRETGYWLRFARGAVDHALGRSVPEAVVRDALDRLRAVFLTPQAWQVYPDVAPALEELRGQGTRLGVVSNWDSRLPVLLEKLGLAGYFEALAVSHLEGVEKPEPALFRRALEKLGAAPELALHVGDVPELDLAGARAAGIDAVLVDRRGHLDPALDALPDLASLPRLAREGLR